MTAKEIRDRQKNLGSQVLFNIIMALIVVVSFAYDIISDYINFGFDKTRLMQAAFWIELAVNNSIRIGLCLTFREVMIDNETRVNRNVLKRTKDIEDAHGIIVNAHLQTSLEEYVDEANRNRRFRMYEAIVKKKLDKSRHKKRIAKYDCKIKCEEAKRRPKQKRLDKLRAKLIKATIHYNKQKERLATAREDSEWKKIRHYRPIRMSTLLSTVDESRLGDDDSLETYKARETVLFISTKVMFIIFVFVFAMSLIPYGKTFELSLLWNTAVKLLFGAISLLLGGSNGVEYVQKVVAPVLMSRVTFLLKFLESKGIKHEKTQEKAVEKEEKETIIESKNHTEEKTQYCLVE